MNVSANKVKFSKLKYEQLLHEKYYVTTCFSKKYESYPPDQKLADIYSQIKCSK